MSWGTRCSFLQGEMLFGALITGERHPLKSFTSSSLDSSRIKPLILQSYTLHSQKDTIKIVFHLQKYEKTSSQVILYSPGLGGAVVLDNRAHAKSVLSHCL